MRRVMSFRFPLQTLFRVRQSYQRRKRMRLARRIRDERGYQANARAVTVADAAAREAINLKH
jgi:hypothetical protein